jgi:predicted dehydrogenase
MIGFMWRFDHEVRFLRDLVISGVIGAPIKTKAFGIHMNWGPSGWFTQKRLAGGGALIDMGVHAIDTTRFILGDPKPRKVYAVVTTSYGDYDVDDTGMVMIEWDQGTTSLIECGWNQPHMDRPYAGTQVFAERGYASIFPTEVKSKVRGVAGTHVPEPPPRDGHPGQPVYDRQMEHFIDCALKLKKPTPGTGQGLTVQRIVDAAYRSSRTGKAIDL